MNDIKFRPDKLGVLGGMGPLATVDFLGKLIALTPAKNDTDHIPVVVSSEPHIPSRGLAAQDKQAPSPLPAYWRVGIFLLRLEPEPSPCPAIPPIIGMVKWRKG